MWRCFILPNMGQGYAVHSEERMSFFKEEEGKYVILVRVCMSTHAHKHVRSPHLPPRGCDCSRRDLYIRVSVYTYVHTYMATHLHTSSKALAQCPVEPSAC